MFELFFAAAAVALYFWLAMRGTELRYWAGAVLALSIVGALLFGFSLWALLGLVVGATMGALTRDNIRKRVLSGPAFGIVKKVLPKMSDTERVALEAGTVWFDGDIFSGKPDFDAIRNLPNPKTALSTREQAFLDTEVETLCEMLDPWQIEQDKDLPPEVWDYLGKNRFFAMIIPESYGGLGFSHQAQSAVVSKIVGRNSTAGVTVMVPNSLGPGELLMKFGTQAQRDYYLPRLADGRDLPCFGLTGPWAGSDAAAMRDYGVVTMGEHEGQQVLGIRLTWEKRYITLGPKATVLGLAFQLEDPDGLLADRDLTPENPEDITLALIPTDYPGVNIGRRHLPGDQAFLNGPNSGTDVFIPMSFVIGGEARLGQGWEMLMNALAAGRAISLPASGTATTRVAAMTTSAYARVRKQFNIPVGFMEGIEEKLAEIIGLSYGCEAARRMTNSGLDEGHKPSVISAMWKYEATERGRVAIDAALDIHAGKAICVGPKNYLFSAYKATPIGITVEGANILTRSLMTFGQGAVRAHPWLQQEMAATAIEDRSEAIDAFDRAFMGHIAHAIGNLARTIAFNVSFGLLAPRPKNAGKAAAWYAQVYRASANFGLLVDVALATMGGSLKRKQKIAGRYSDAFGEIYIMSAVLKRWEDEGKNAADWPLAEYALRRGLYNTQQAFAGILANHPIRPLAWVLGLVIFPFGKRRSPASDKLGHAVVQAVMTPSETRNRLNEGLFVSQDQSDAINELERAFVEVQDIDAIEKRMRKAIKDGKLSKSDKPVEQRQLAQTAGIITADELARMETYEQLLRSIIDVDDFSHEELSPRLAGLDHNSRPGDAKGIWSI